MSSRKGAKPKLHGRERKKGEEEEVKRQPFEISSRNGYGFPGYAYFLASTAATSRKRVSIKDAWDMHTFLVAQLLPGIPGESVCGV